MKKFLAFLIATFTFAQTPITATYDDLSFESLDLTPLVTADCCTKPFKLQLNYDITGKAKVRKCRGFNHVQFSQGEVEGTIGFYSNPCYSEYAAFSLGYIQTFFDWEHNPFFHQTHFNTLSTKISFSTQRVRDWRWITELAANFDTDHFSDLDSYVNFDFIVWGRYTYWCNLGLHVGFLGYTGMKIDRVYPIIGVDYRYDSNWKFNAIFPINFSVVYTVNPNWSVSLASRVFDVRHRVSKHARLEQGLWAYRTVGAELAADYDYNSWIDLNFHIGYTLGGKFKISNRNNHHGRRFRLDPTGYIGAQALVKF